MKVKKIFLIICMIFAVKTGNAQFFSSKTNTDKAFSLYFPHSFNVGINKNFPALGISPNFYYCNIGFFCKQEIKLENATKIPLKFRVGSLQYYDWLEKKPGSGILKPVN